MPDELETILRLVADRSLSPEEAAPIIEALTRAERTHADPAQDAVERLGRHAERLDHGIHNAHIRVDRAIADVNERLEKAGGRHLRIQVKEGGRQRVNLRIPIGLVDAAIGFVPGLGGDQAERIRDAVRTGAVGPIIDVEDDDGESVLISVE
jgi:hypothetical protein